MGVRPPIWMLVLASIAATAVVWNSRESAHPSPSDWNVFTRAPAPGEISTSHPQTHPEVNGFLSYDRPRELPQSILLQLSDPDADVRRSALSLVPILTPTNYDVVPILTACLNDADPEIRAAATQQLSEMRLRASAAVPKLKELAKFDSDERVQSRAKDALYNIRGYDYSPSARDL